MRWLFFWASATALFAACDSDVTSESGTATGNGGSGTGASSTTATGASAGAPTYATCFDTPPAGAMAPPAFPTYSGGSCPTLAPGNNMITTMAGTREFVVVVPSDRAAGETLPLVFLWHWLNGSAEDFIQTGEVQQSADLYRFVAVVPREKGDVQFTWPMTSLDSQARTDEELAFFDDMLACAGEQLNIMAHCVSSAGVSAGALFTASVIAPLRGQYLASFLSLSGGVGGVIHPWQSSAHKMPGLVLWGGPMDNCAGLLNFEDLSHTLEDALTTDGHFFVECVHNCGHAQPPFDGAATATAPLWQFIIDHPYWLGDGESPYQQGLPAGMPEWCGIGKGGATPRMGECLNPNQC